MTWGTTTRRGRVTRKGPRPRRDCPPLPRREGDVVTDEADAPVAERDHNPARVIAARRGLHVAVRRPGLDARHPLLRVAPTPPDRVRGRRVRPVLGGKGVPTHGAVRPRAARVLVGRPGGTRQAVLQLAQTQGVREPVRHVGEPHLRIVAEQPADGRVIRVGAAVPALAVTGRVVAAGQVLHVRAVGQLLLVDWVNRAVHRFQVLVADQVVGVLGLLAEPVHHLRAFPADLVKVRVQGRLLNVIEDVTDPRAANARVDSATGRREREELTVRAAAVAPVRVVARGNGAAAGVRIHRPGRQLTVGRFVVVQRERELLQLVLTLHPRGRRAHLLDGGE